MKSSPKAERVHTRDVGESGCVRFVAPDVVQGQRVPIALEEEGIALKGFRHRDGGPDLMKMDAGEAAERADRFLDEADGKLKRPVRLVLQLSKGHETNRRSFDLGKPYDRLGEAGGRNADEMLRSDVPHLLAPATKRVHLHWPSTPLDLHDADGLSGRTSHTNDDVALAGVAASEQVGKLDVVLDSGMRNERPLQRGDDPLDEPPRGLRLGCLLSVSGSACAAPRRALETFASVPTWCQRAQRSDEPPIL